MADKIENAKKTMIQNIEAKTGKPFEEWVSLALNSGEDKVGAMIKYLKSTHGLTHGYANFVALTARDRKAEAAGAPEVDPVEAMYAGPKAHLRPIYDRILAEVRTFGPDFEESPKKAYVSLRRNKQFAIVKPSTKTRVDIGLNLKGKTPAGRLEDASSWMSMCTHRVRIESMDDLDQELLAWLKEAFDAA